MAPTDRARAPLDGWRDDDDSRGANPSTVTTSRSGESSSMTPPVPSLPPVRDSTLMVPLSYLSYDKYISPFFLVVVVRLFGYVRP